jgi:hypothetical protein
MPTNRIVKEGNYMTFEDRKKAVLKAQKLVNKNQDEIDTHPFVVQKRKLIDKHKNTVTQLLSECTHDEVERKSEYYSGSYYDKAHTDYWTVCVLCGTRSERTHETHSWYG